MNDDDPSLAFGAGPAVSVATRPVNKVTWELAGRVTDPGAAFTLVRTLTSPPAKTDEEPAGEEFRLGTFELRIGSNYSDGEK